MVVSEHNHTRAHRLALAKTIMKPSRLGKQAGPGDLSICAPGGYMSEPARADKVARRLWLGSSTQPISFSGVCNFLHVAATQTAPKLSLASAHSHLGRSLSN